MFLFPTNISYTGDFMIPLSYSSFCVNNNLSSPQGNYNSLLCLNLGQEETENINIPYKTYVTDCFIFKGLKTLKSNVGFI